MAFFQSYLVRNSGVGWFIFLCIPCYKNIASGITGTTGLQREGGTDMT